MSNYKVGDKFEIEIAEVFNGDELHGDSKLYRIRGFDFLVLDEHALNMLKAKERIKTEVTPIKTVKASELAVDTKVFCSNVINITGCLRYFAGFFGGIPYTFVNGETSVDSDKMLVTWKYITLEDGTIVLPE